MRQALKKTGFIHPNLRAGFTLIELIIAILLIGMMAMIVIPNLGGGDTLVQSRQKFVAELNQFVVGARYAALVSSKLQRVVFDLRSYQLLVETSTDAKDSQGQLQFEASKSNYVGKNFNWDKSRFAISSLYINGKDVLTIEGGADKAWFYFMPDGLAQNVVINFNDLAEQDQLGVMSENSLVLNPFAGQFEFYETFQRPN